MKRPDEEDLPADHEPLLRTLYLLQHGQVLGKESERLIVRQEQKIVREIPAIKVDQIMVFGNAQITTQAMQFCLQERIPIYLLSGQGHYYGVIDSFNTEPVLLQREQFLRANDPCILPEAGRCPGAWQSSQQPSYAATSGASAQFPCFNHGSGDT